MTCLLPPTRGGPAHGRFALCLTMGLVLGLSTPAAAQVTQRPGDVNADAAVSVIDVQQVINVALGIAPAQPEADVDGNGQTVVTDVQLVVNIALGIPTITRLDPPAAAPGETLTVIGFGFAPQASDNTVQLSGAGLPASSVQSISGTPVAVTVTIPPAAVTGSVRVVAGGVTISGPSLSVLVSLQARVSVAPVAGAAVEAFAVSGGVKGASLGTGLTDASGLASLYFAAQPGYTGLVLVEASDGSFADPRTGATTPVDGLLRSVESRAGAGVVTELAVTPLSSLTLAIAERHPSGLQSSTLAEVRAAFATRSGGADPISTRPLDLTTTVSGAPGALDLAILNAAFAELAAELGAASIGDLLDRLATDLDDGRIDGHDTLNALTLVPESAPPASLARRAQGLVDSGAFGAGVTIRVATLDALATTAPDLGELFSPRVSGFDRVPPQVLATVPAPDETDVPTDSALLVRLDSDVDPASVNSVSLRLFQGSQPLAATVQFDAATGLARLTPAAPLPSSTSLTLSIDGTIRDRDGLRLDRAIAIPFSTAAGPLGGTPTVTSVTPTDGATGADADAIVLVPLDRAVDPGSLAGAVTLTAGGATLPAVVDARLGSSLIRITPQVPLPAGVEVTVQLSTGLTDLAGNALAASVTSRFTVRAAGVADLSSPNLGLFSSSPGPGDRLSLSPTELLRPANLPGAITLSAGAPLDARIQFDSRRGLLEISPRGELLPGSSFELLIGAGLTDRAGNAALAQQRSLVAALAAVEIRGLTLTGASAGRSYATSPVVLGVEPPLSWSLEPGATLPSGLTLSATGELSGMPIATGTAEIPVRVSDATGATLSATLSLAVAPPPSGVVVDFAAAASEVGEGAGTTDILLTLDTPAPLTADVTVAVSTNPPGVGGARPGDDFSTSATVTFPAGSMNGATQALTVSLVDDGLFESDEDVELVLTGASGAQLGAIRRHRLTLLDDETPPAVSIQPTMLSVDESVGIANLTVTLSGPTAIPVSADLALTGTASVPGDLTIRPGLVISGFASALEPGITSRDIELEVVDDRLFEGDETLTITLTGLVGGVLGVSSATVTITENDGPADLNVGDATASEGAGSISIPISLSAPATAPVTFSISALPIAPASIADFVMPVTSGGFAIGEDQTSITIALVDDGQNEPMEMLAVTVSQVSGATAIDADALAVILDDDPLMISSADISLDESSSSPLTFPLSTTSQSPIRFGFQITPDATAGVTPGLDLNPAVMDLTIPAGASTGELFSLLRDDNLHELDESFVLTVISIERDDGQGFLPAPDLSFVGAGPRVTVVDDDAILAMVEDMAVVEGESVRNVMLITRWSGPSAVGATVTLNATGLTATAGVDFVAITGQTLQLPGDGLTTTTTTALTILGDPDEEVDETIAVSLSNPTSPAGRVSASTQAALFTLLNDERISAISTIVGNGQGGAPVPGQQATRFPIQPRALAPSPGGEVYILDRVAIYQLELDNTLTKIAGGQGGGLGGPALDFPIDADALAVDGNLLVFGRRNRSELYQIDLTTGIVDIFAVGAPCRQLLFEPSGDLLALSEGIVRRISRMTRLASTVIGDTNIGTSGDGGPATLARTTAEGMLLEPNGDILLAETQGARLRRISAATGIITTIAGTGQLGGPSGDGGPATQAQIVGPRRLARSRAGELFILAGSTIRKIDTAGIITTVAGTGSDAREGVSPLLSPSLGQFNDMVFDGNGRLLLASFGQRFVREIIGFDGPAMSRRAPALGLVGEAYEHTIRSSAGDARIVGWSISSGSLPAGLRLESDAARARLVGTPSSAGRTDFTLEAQDSQGRTESFTFRVEVEEGLVTERPGITDDFARALAFAPNGDLFVMRSDRSVHVQLAGTTTWQMVHPFVTASPRFASMVYEPYRGVLLYFDNSSAVVRALTRGGVETIFAGIPFGSLGFSGDGGPAREARFTSLGDIEVDGLGNVYLSANQRIRRIDTADIVTTIAGNGDLIPSGDGGPALSAGIGNISAMALSNRTLFLYDVNSYLLRRLDLDSGIIEAVGGVAGARMSGGDGGPVAQATFHLVREMICDSLGNLYLAEGDPQRILRRVHAGTGIIESIAGGGSRRDTPSPALDAFLEFYELDFDPVSGELHIGSSEGLRRLTAIPVRAGFAITTPTFDSVELGQAASFVVHTAGGSGSGYQWSVSQGALPMGMALIPGTPRANLVGLPTEPGEFVFELTVSDDQGAIARRTLVIQVPPVAIRDVTLPAATVGLDYEARLISSGGSRVGADWQLIGGALPAGLALVSEGNSARIVGRPSTAETQTFTIRILDSLGDLDTATYTLSSSPPTPVATIESLTFRGLNRLVMTEGGAQLATTGEELLELGPRDDFGRLRARVSSDSGAAWHPGLRRLLIADQATDRVLAVDPVSGEVVPFAGNGTSGYSGDGGLATNAQLQDPVAVAVDGAGLVYVAEEGNHVVRRIEPGPGGLPGTITTLTGSGAAGFGGDSGPAGAAILDTPTSVVVDGSILYVADAANSRIRAIDLGAGTISTAVSVSAPRALAVDASGRLVFMSAANLTASNQLLLRFNPAGGLLEVLAGGGNDPRDNIPLDEVRFDDVQSIAVDSLGRVLVLASGRIRVVQLP